MKNNKEHRNDQNHSLIYLVKNFIVKNYKYNLFLMLQIFLEDWEIVLF